MKHEATHFSPELPKELSHSILKWKSFERLEERSESKTATSIFGHACLTAKRTGSCREYLESKCKARLGASMYRRQLKLSSMRASHSLESLQSPGTFSPELWHTTAFQGQWCAKEFVEAPEKTQLEQEGEVPVSAVFWKVKEQSIRRRKERSDSRRAENWPWDLAMGRPWQT